MTQTRGSRMVSKYDGNAPIPGDVLFFKGNPHKLIDKLIMGRTGGDVVHVSIVYDTNLVIQAVSGGVELAGIPTNYSYLAHTGKILLDEGKGEDVVRALHDVRGRVGDKYGLGDILDQALSYLPGHPAISFDRSEDCSHLAAAFLQDAGFSFPFDTTDATVTPVSLKELLNPEEIER